MSETHQRCCFKLHKSLTWRGWTNQDAIGAASYSVSWPFDMISRLKTGAVGIDKDNDIAAAAYDVVVLKILAVHRNITTTGGSVGWSRKVAMSASFQVLPNWRVLN